MAEQAITLDQAAETLVGLVNKLKASNGLILEATNDNAALGAGASALRFDPDAWDARQRFEGDAPPERWLVGNSLPLGELGMVAAMGDTGKGMLLLELALRVASGKLDLGRPSIFDGHVESFGNVVSIAAEDSQAAIHRRLRRLDPDGSRLRNCAYKLTIVPLPDAGGPFPLIVQKGHQIEITPAFHELRAHLVRLRPTLVVLDPLTPFCHADLNADALAAGVLCSALAQLAAETGATVMFAHHMRKPDRKHPIETPQDAREQIRGSTGLVDGVRAVYAVWPEPDKAKIKAACQQVGRRDDGHSVYRGGIAKANGSQARTWHQLVRGPSGLLEQVVADADARRPGEEELEQLLIAAIADAAKAGQPFTASAAAQNGLYTRRAILPPPLSEFGKERLTAMVESAEKAGKIVRALASGTSAKWLDVPGGDFANGIGTFAQGAMRGKPGRKGATKAPGSALERSAA